MREEGSPFPSDIWRHMAALGWLGLPFEERYGGFQRDWITLAAVVEELGRACDPTPFVDSILTCGWLLQDIASEEQKHRWLPPLIRGELTLSLALLEQESNWSPESCHTTLHDTPHGLFIRGRKMFVENAANADFILATVRSEQSAHLELALVSPMTQGVELIRVKSLAHPNLYEVRFNNATVPVDQIIRSPANLSAALHKAITRTAAFQSAAAASGAQKVLEVTVAYPKERHQFGKPIGSFQAVQHMLANAWTEVETSWLASYEAITQLQLNLAAEDKVAVARCASNESFTRTCFTAHQVFGGMGYMWETDLHFWARKAKEIEMGYGGLHRYRRQLAGFL